ncbi:MAG: ATP synthase F1 subunit delta [Chitinophagaceae bacterium]|nr:ATP synthase F1 subunit delta [Chitinophagaceae bacterium]MCW5926259.1 ATP synthase F1 subunit delta [Chitinophagaceae bacterium]
MLHPRLAARYAKSIIDLAVEQNQLESLHSDLVLLQSLCKQSRELVAVIKSPVIPADKKIKILDAITNGKVSNLTTAFNQLLVKKGREAILPEIVDTAIEQYNAIKGIYKVKLTTAQPISEALKSSIEQKVKAEAGLANIELTTEVKDELIGGFVLEFNNNLVDASILRDLKDIRKQFRDNVYIKNIR